MQAVILLFNNKKIVWQPQPKQQIFMQRPEYEALYGGAAGGGKSDALLVEALRQIHIPHYKAIIFRKTFPQLSELIERSQIIYKSANPRAKYNGSSHCWTFPSGAKIYFGNMQHAKDKVNYQGKQFDFVAFDELTHFTFEEYSYMFSRNRPSGAGTRVYIRSSTNPGGVGHGWVKERFITPSPPLTPIKDNYNVVFPDGNIKEMERKRIFVPSTIFDNQELLKNDPNYLANLSMLPEAEKNALLYGSWDSFDGQVFKEWVNDPAHYADRVNTHVIEPFDIPKHWIVYRGFDFGYTKPFSVGWYTADENGKLYRISEYYGCTGTPNTGLKINPVEIASNIRQIENEHPLLRGRKIIGIADPSIFDESRGESVAYMMSKSPNFIYFNRGDNTRIAGKMQIHYRLAFDDNGSPMFQCFNTCKHFIRTLPNLVYSESKVEDINTDTEDHIYDEFRYVCMNSPISPKLKKIAPYTYDPLNQRTNRDYKV